MYNSFIYILKLDSIQLNALPPFSLSIAFSMEIHYFCPDKCCFSRSTNDWSLWPCACFKDCQYYEHISITGKVKFATMHSSTAFDPLQMHRAFAGFFCWASALSSPIFAAHLFRWSRGSCCWVHYGLLYVGLVSLITCILQMFEVFKEVIF